MSKKEKAKPRRVPKKIALIHEQKEPIRWWEPIVWAAIIAVAIGLAILLAG